MSTYKAAVIEKKGAKFTIKNLPFRDLKPNEVLVKVEACGVCHSDSITPAGFWTGATFPMVPGHEVVGIIEKVGSGVPANRKLAVGTRVGRGWHGAHCFGCDACMDGDFVLCDDGTVSGIHQDGGYAEYMYAPWESLALVPTGLNSAEAAPLCCAGVTTFHSLREMKVPPPALVAVLGLGGLGHLAVQFAAKMGYTVAAISGSAGKEALAKQLGATHYINNAKGDASEQLQKLGGAAVIIATAFDSNTMGTLMAGLGRNGTLLVIGADPEPMKINGLGMIGKKTALKGWASGTAFDSQATMEFAAQNHVKTIIEEFPLDQVQAAYDRMMSGKAHFRVVLKP